jgi:hypothetical protein
LPRRIDACLRAQGWYTEYWRAKSGLLNDIYYDLFGI